MEAHKHDYQEHKGELKKQLGLLESVAIVIGVVIGSGIFFKPAVVFKHAGSSTLGLLAWVVGGIITMASGLTIAEIAAAIPRVGGLFAYLKELYGDFVAFLFGWVQSLIYIPGAVAALAIVFATQATYFLPMSKMNQRIFAIIIIAFLMTINATSTKFGGRVQSIATIIKLIPIIILVLLGLFRGTAEGLIPIISNKSSISGFGAAVLGTLWAYDGWINVGNMAGEIKNPAKNLPRAIISGLSIVMIVYLAVNFVVLKILSYGSVVNSEGVAVEAAVSIFRRGGASFITFGILISIFGAINGYILTGARVPLAMAQEGLLPFEGFFGYISEKHGTPVNALLFQFVMASLYVISGSFDTITDLVVFVLWIFFTMAAAGVFILRKNHKRLKRPYQVPLYPLTPIVAIAGGMFVVLSTFFSNIINAMVGIGITLIGIPLYMYVKRDEPEEW